MKTILLAMSAVSAMAAAAPAAAQYRTSYPDKYQDQAYGQVRAGGDVDARIDQLQARLDADVQQGTINQRDSWALRRQLRELRRLSSQYGMDGLSAGERADLQQRLRYVRDRIQVADRGTDGRYGRADRYGAYDNQGNVEGANGNGYYGQGGPYEEVDQADICQGRGGVAGFVDNVLGGGCLRVGQRATADLGGVPYEYRGQYRDGGGVYYRSDGRAIYRIDARTNAIVGVYPMAR
jgi:hypothetical protein